MYRAYFHDDLTDSLDPVGVPADDAGDAFSSARDFHARYVCDSAADYSIVGPDGDTVARVTLPAAGSGALAGA